MTTPTEPELTDAQMVRALGWDDADDSEPDNSPDTSVEGTPAVGSDDTTPAPEPAPTPTPEPVPQPAYTAPAPSPDPLQAARDAEVVQLRHQAQVGQINQQAQRQMDNLVSQGWGQDQARQSAEQFAQNEYQKYQNGELTRVANENARDVLAYELSGKTGTPVEVLKVYSDPKSMEQAATLYQGTQGRINELQKQVNANSKAPVQSFDSNSMTSSNSTEAKKLRYATDPNYNPTDAEFAQMGLS